MTSASGKSWDHSVIALQRIHSFYGVPEQCTAARKCPNVAEYEVQYRYVTGARGRVTTNSKRACAGHAAQFSVKHAIELPPAAFLKVHQWKPVDGKTLEICSTCGQFRERVETGFSWHRYKSDSDLSVCEFLPKTEAQTA